MSAPSISNDGDPNTGIYFPAADTIGFVEGGVESMRLDSSGNLGLGVTPSAASLPTIHSAYGLVTGNSEAHIARNAYFAGGWKYQTASTATRASQAGGEFQWFTAPSGTADSAISFTQAMTLDASGQLQVGTASAISTNASPALVSFLGANKTNSNEVGILTIASSDSYAQDKGGSIGFVYKYNTAGGYATGARIYGAKENNTDGSWNGYIGFCYGCWWIAC